MAKREKNYRCAACNFRLHNEAYYCKKCGALVDPSQAPDARKIDKSLITRYNRFISMSPFSKLAWGLLIVAGGASFTFFFGNLFHASTDNNSSSTFVLKVETPYAPFTCSGAVCHVSISIENKSDKTVLLTGDAYMRGPDGKLHGPADPTRATGRLISYGQFYCQHDFHMMFGPHQTNQTIGICVEGINPGDLVKQVLIKDKSGKILVTTDLNVAVPQ